MHASALPDECQNLHLISIFHYSYLKMGLSQMKWKVEGAHCPLAGAHVSKVNSRRVTEEDTGEQRKGAEFAKRGELLFAGVSEMPFNSKVACGARAGLAAWEISTHCPPTCCSKAELRAPRGAASWGGAARGPQATAAIQPPPPPALPHNGVILQANAGCIMFPH